MPRRHGLNWPLHPLQVFLWLCLSLALFFSKACAFGKHVLHRLAVFRCSMAVPYRAVLRVSDSCLDCVRRLQPRGPHRRQAHRLGPGCWAVLGEGFDHELSLVLVCIVLVCVLVCLCACCLVYSEWLLGFCQRQLW